MSTNPDYLPETPEELTADWLSTALGTRITGVDQQVLGEGQGFMGDILRLRLESEAAAVPATVVAKLPKKANRAMGELIGVYEREIMFFRTFARDLPVRVPALVYSEFDRDRGSENQERILRVFDKMPRFLTALIGAMGARIAAAKNRRYMLLIEDLGHMRPADQLAGLDESGCIQVLTSIAPLHRKYWQSPELHGHFWLLPLDVDARLRHGMFKQNYQRFGAVLGPELAATLAWLHRHGEALTRRFVAEAPETLTHCDLRLDNVIFDDEQCAFIDWQLVRRAPAAYDVAYFLSSALREEAAPAEDERILRSYHQALGIGTYDYETFRRDYQRAMLLNLANLASADDVDFGNERGDTMMKVWMRRLASRARLIDPAGLMP